MDGDQFQSDSSSRDDESEGQGSKRDRSTRRPISARRRARSSAAPARFLAEPNALMPFAPTRLWRLPTCLLATIVAIGVLAPSAVSEPPRDTDYHCGNIALDLGTYYAKQDPEISNPLSTQGSAQCVTSATTQNAATPTFPVTLAFTGNIDPCRGHLGLVTWSGQLTFTPAANTGYSPFTTSVVISGTDPPKGKTTNGSITTDAGHSGHVAISATGGSNALGVFDSVCEHIQDVSARVSNGAVATSDGAIDVVGNAVADVATAAGPVANTATTVGPALDQAGNAVQSVHDAVAQSAVGPPTEDARAAVLPPVLTAHANLRAATTAKSHGYHKQRTCNHWPANTKCYVDDAHNWRQAQVRSYSGNIPRLCIDLENTTFITTNCVANVSGFTWDFNYAYANHWPLFGVVYFQNTASRRTIWGWFWG